MSKNFTRSGIVMIATFVASFYSAAVAADAPTCGSAQVKDSISADAKQFVDENIQNADIGPIRNMRSVYFPEETYDITLSEMFEVSRTDAVRTCAAKLSLVVPGRTAGTVPIDYFSINTEDEKFLFKINSKEVRYQELIAAYSKLNNLEKSLIENNKKSIRKFYTGQDAEISKGYAATHPDMNKPVGDPRY